MEDKDAQFAQTENEFTVDQKTGMLVHDGQKYADTPRIRELIKKANTIQKQLPPVLQGCTRLWRGNRPGEVGQNPSFTNSLVGIALPFAEGYEGEITYVDVPTEALGTYMVEGAPGAEFILTPQLAQTATIVPDPLRLTKPAVSGVGAHQNPPSGWDRV